MIEQSGSSAGPRRILIVDDEAGIRDLLQEILSIEGYETVARNSGRDGIAAYREQHFDLVLVDLLMPGMHGSEVARILTNETPGLPVVLITGSDSDTVESQTVNIPIAAIITKPFVLDEVIDTVRALIGPGI